MFDVWRRIDIGGRVPGKKEDYPMTDITQSRVVSKGTGPEDKSWRMPLSGPC